MAKQETLCWRCKRPGTNTCSWDKSCGTIPVEGWDAEETRLRDNNGQGVTSYLVHECPLFDPEENYDYRMTHSVGLGAEKEVRKWTRIDHALMERCFEQRLDDRVIALRCGCVLTTVQDYKRKWKRKQQERKVENEDESET